MNPQRVKVEGGALSSSKIPVCGCVRDLAASRLLSSPLAGWNSVVASERRGEGVGGEAVDGRPVGERFVADDIDLQVLLCGQSTLELIEVRAAGFGMPKLEGGETAVIGHFGIEVDDLEDTKAELTRRGVVLQGEVKTDEVHFIFTAPQTTFGVTLQLMEHKGRRTGA